jgi:hypothetical protein
MGPLDTVRQYSPPPRTAAVVVANALPLVGVVALGWDLVALVALYWFELGVLSLWAVVEALFAGRPSEFDGDPLIAGALVDKQTGLAVPFTPLQIRLSTLPVLAVAVPLLAVVWFFAGAVTVGILGQVPDRAALQTVTVAAAGLFVAEGASTVVDYLYRGGYREHSAQTAIRGVFVRGAVIGLGGLFTALVVGLGTGAVSPDEPLSALNSSVVGPPLLVGIVLVKFGFDLAGLYRDRLVAVDEASYFELGWAYEPPTDDPPAPLDRVVTRVRPSAVGRLLGGLSLSNLRRHPGALAPGVLLWFVALLFALGRAWAFVAGLVAAGLAVTVGLLAVDSWLRYGAIEYRVSGDAVVAYDRLLRTPVWRVEPWDESGLRVERDRLHRWFGTSTVVVEFPDRERRLPHLRAPDAVLAVFERRAGEP